MLNTKRREMWGQQPLCHFVKHFIQKHINAVQIKIYVVKKNLFKNYEFM